MSVLDRVKRFRLSGESSEVLSSTEAVNVFNSGGSDQSELSEGKMVIISVGRAWRKAKITDFDGDVYELVDKVGKRHRRPRSEILTLKEAGHLAKSRNNTQIER